MSRTPPTDDAVRPGRWTGFAAAAVAFAFAAVSLYWALGGRALLDTLGGEIERRARAGDDVLLAANAVGVVLKLLGGVLALALVQPWGERLPRRPLLVVAWAGAAVLSAYGVLQTVSIILVALDRLELDEPLDTRALRWRMFLWEPWFLVWGVLLGSAAWHFQVRTREQAVPR
jgi:hypothetical protein